MASPAELARSVAGYDDRSVDHMQRLFRSWALLADLGLGDALLLAPIWEEAEKFVVLANVRPATAPTLYSHDPVGDIHDEGKRPLVASAWETGTIQAGTVELGPHFPAGSAEIIAAPFLLDGRPIGVVLTERRARDRPLLQLEQTYAGLAERMMQMIADGLYPFNGPSTRQYGEPRVGDGVLVLDGAQRVVFQSPNAVSALHRLGSQRTPLGRRLTDIGIDDSFVRTAFARRTAVIQEQDRGDDVTVTSRCIPLVNGEEVTGGFILMRDISELKRRDRLLVSKDATIREIHHRVKNNLQTISSLLRLQARRVQSEEGREALGESVRRIAAIAIVHETLANDVSDDASGDDAPFLDVAKPLIRLIEEGLQGPDDRIEFSVEGDPGRLPLIRSQPLAVVLTELLQNVVDHAFPDGLVPVDGRRVRMVFAKEAGDLSVQVMDNGHGPPDGFEIEHASGLGLTLVHTFVTTELRGTIEMFRGDGPGDTPGCVTRILFPRSWEDRVAGPEL